jgi:hypothetical protein
VQTKKKGKKTTINQLKKLLIQSSKQANNSEERSSDIGHELHIPVHPKKVFDFLRKKIC